MTTENPSLEANTSGKGTGYPVPDVIAKKFNWGAFLWTWIWGLGNRTYITLLMIPAMFLSFIPVVGWLISLGLCIWFGIKGNEWAWQNKYFESVEAFHESQKKWVIAFFIFFAVFFFIGFFMGLAGIPLPTK